jgi:hypothetical protein
MEMSDNSAPQQTSEIKSEPTPTSLPAQPANVTPNLDPEKTKALAEAVNSILRGIPFVGPYIVIIKLKWGWTGILLIIGGFLIAAVLFATGIYPEMAVADKYKKDNHPTEKREYELKLQQDILWDTLIRNARSRIWASGVALKRLNPQLISERVKEGVNAQIVYVDPCGETISKRQDDEKNPDAAGNIKSNLKTFDTYTKDLNETQRSSLQVKLTDAYPTMIVVIIDNDLYAYFCPYGAVCSGSPVLVFKGYQETASHPAAKFFEDHFRAIFTKAKRIDNYNKPCSLPLP